MAPSPDDMPGVGAISMVAISMVVISAVVPLNGDHTESPGCGRLSLPASHFTFLSCTVYCLYRYLPESHGYGLPSLQHKLVLEKNQPLPALHESADIPGHTLWNFLVPAVSRYTEERRIHRSDTGRQCVWRPVIFAPVDEVCCLAQKSPPIIQPLALTLHIEPGIGER